MLYREDRGWGFSPGKPAQEFPVVDWLADWTSQCELMPLPNYL